MPGPTDPPDWVKENKGKTQSAFDRARSAQQIVPQKAPEPVQSQQVRQSAPTMQPKPPLQVRQAADRSAHNDRMQQDSKAAELARARELAASIRHKDNEAQKAKEKDKER